MKKKLLVPVCIVAGLLISVLLLAVNLNILLKANELRQAFLENIAQARDYKSVLGKGNKDSEAGRQDASGQDANSQNAGSVNSDKPVSNPGSNEHQTSGSGHSGAQAYNSGANIPKVSNPHTSNTYGGQKPGTPANPHGNMAGKTGEIKPDSKKANTINVLFLGIDRDLERDKTLGIYRTDTIALAVIDMDTKKVDVLCIPRDTYAYVPVEGKMDKINHAYAYGSLEGKAVESSVDAVNHFIKYSKVDYYFAIDMEPIPEIVDYLGGVDVSLDMSMRLGGVWLPKGKHRLNGDQALGYVRYRSSGRGDIDRIIRQQKFAREVFSQLKNSNKILESLKLALTYRSHIKTNMNLQQLLAFGNLASEIAEEDIHSTLVPGQAKTINNMSCWIPDEAETDKILQELF